jgi:hypothetical protein
MRGPGHGILVRAEREAREDARRPMRCSPTTRSFGRPAMVWRPGFTVAAPVERVWEAQVSEKGSRRGSRVCFIGRGGEGGAMAGVMAFNGHGGPAGLDCIQGRGLIGEETEGVMEGGEAPRLNCTLTVAIQGGEAREMRGVAGGGARCGAEEGAGGGRRG